MNTKRINDKYNRLDIKIPIDIYNQVSEIAVNSFDAKIHHISNKPEITPTLLYLLELGIESFLGGNELTKKPNTDNYTDTIPITDNEVKELIKKELLPMHERLNDLLTIQSQVDELKAILYRLTNTDNLTDNVAVELINDTDTITDNDTDTIKEDANTSPIQSQQLAEDTPEVDNTKDSTLLELPISSIVEELGQTIPNEELTANNEDIPIIDSELTVTESEIIPNCDSEIKSFEEAKKEVERLRSLGKDNGAIAKSLTGNYFTASGTGTIWRNNQVKRIVDDMNKLTN